MKRLFLIYNELAPVTSNMKQTHFALFGFIPDKAGQALPNLTLQVVRSPWNHKNDYASAGDRTTCLASLTLKAKSLIKYPA